MTSTAHRADWAEQLRSINQAFALREEALSERLGSALAELEPLRARMAELTGREQQLLAQIETTRQAAETVLQQAERRLNDATRSHGVQVQALQSQLDSSAAELTSQHQRLEKLVREHASEQIALKRDLTVAREQCARIEQESTRREQALSDQVAKAIGALQSQAHEHAVVQKALLDAHERAVGLQQQRFDQRAERHRAIAQGAQELELELRRHLAVERLAQQELHAALGGTRDELDALRGSWSWRLTHPFRTFRAPPTLTAHAADTADSSPSSSQSLDPAQHPQVCAEIVQAPVGNLADNNACRPPGEDILKSQQNAEVMMPRFTGDRNATSVGELLALHNNGFVHAAYVALLGRAPDSPGMSSHLKQLELGVSKEEILVGLATSAEGRAFTSAIDGLDQLLASYRKQDSFSLRGLFLRLRNATTRPIERQLRSLEGAIHALERRSDMRLAAIETGLRELSQLTRTALTSPNPRLGDTTLSPLPQQLKPALGVSIVFNLSTSRHWRAEPVGIIRVERELASYLMQFSDVNFVAFDANSDRFSVLSSAEAEEILSTDWITNQHIPRQPFSMNQQYLPKTNDNFVSIGLDWDFSPTHHIAKKFAESGCRIILACYDLVPVMFPEFCARRDLDQIFKRHFVDMAHTATDVFTISHNSRKDLLDFWEVSNLEAPLPRVQSIRLANLTVPEPLPVLRESDTDRLRHIKSLGRFVLYVSSFEPRKNHRLLLNIWNDIYEECAEDCPTLVLVGMAGWGSSDLIAQMQRMKPHKAGKIIWLSDVNDAFLLHLYESCHFTVFPSHYEGWGLAATEALAFQKICVISDSSALSEASQDLMPKFHPLDYKSWKSEIKKILDDESYKEKLETSITTKFTNRSWTEFCDEFIEQFFLSNRQI